MAGLPPQPGLSRGANTNPGARKKQRRDGRCGRWVGVEGGRGAPRSMAVGKSRVPVCRLRTFGSKGGIGTEETPGVHRGGKGAGKKANKKRTAPSVPKWSPTSVLTGPD